MKKIAWSAFVAFWASVFTLLAVLALLPKDSTPNQSPAINANPKPDASSKEQKWEIISLDELARHNTESDCWKAIHGKVYNVTEMIHSHPSSPEIFTKWCGQDATAAFDDKGNGDPHSEAAELMLEDYQIGVLEINK